MLVDQAVRDLVDRYAIPPAEVHVASAGAVVWPDHGLGCPRPGMQYRQVPVDGVLVELEARGQRYRYHAGNGRAPFLCEGGVPAAPLRSVPHSPG